MRGDEARGQKRQSETPHSSSAGQLHAPTHPPTPPIAVPVAVTSHGTMALSDAAAQVASRHRDARSQARKNRSSAMMLVVMVIVMAVMGVTAFARRFAAHRHPTPFTELRRLRLHASRDPRDVGNNVRTKPHRVGRACLTRGVAALGGRAIETAEKHNGQHKCTGQVNNPHVFPQGLAIVVCAANAIAAPPARRKVAKVRSSGNAPRPVPSWRIVGQTGPGRGRQFLLPGVHRGEVRWLSGVRGIPRS
jgi:hypothetical protein